MSAFIYTIYFNFTRNLDVLGWNRVIRAIYYYFIVVAEL